MNVANVCSDAAVVSLRFSRAALRLSTLMGKSPARSRACRSTLASCRTLPGPGLLLKPGNGFGLDCRRIQLQLEGKAAQEVLCQIGNVFQPATQRR